MIARRTRTAREQGDADGEETEETDEARRGATVLHLFFGRRKIDIWNVGKAFTVFAGTVGVMTTCVTFTMSALGWRLTGNTDDVAAVAARVTAAEGQIALLRQTTDSMSRTLAVLRDAKCVELTREQLAYAQIDCRRVFARMRQADQEDQLYQQPRRPQ